MKFLNFFFLFLLIGCDSNPVYKNTSATRNGTINNEKTDFKSLMEKDLLNKNQVTAKVLTYLLNDPETADKNTAAVIENTSSCDIVVRMVGISNGQIYNLPVYARSKNQFIIQKGKYTLKSDLCRGKYYSQKNISEPLLLKLSEN